MKAINVFPKTPENESIISALTVLAELEEDLASDRIEALNNIFRAMADKTSSEKA